MKLVCIVFSLCIAIITKRIRARLIFTRAFEHIRIPDSRGRTVRAGSTPPEFGIGFRTIRYRVPVVGDPVEIAEQKRGLNSKR